MPLAPHLDLQRERLQTLLLLARQELKEARQAGLSDMEIKEAGSASDFASLLGNLMYRELMPWFNTVPSDWREYTRRVSTEDYRPRTIILGAEAENLLFVGQNGTYQDSREYDRYFQVQVTKFGRLFRVTRSVIMNDDLGYIQQQPERFGRAAARTISSFVPQSILEANPNCFDGQSLFSTGHVAGTGTYANLASGASTSLTGGQGLQAIQTAVAAMAVAKAFDGVIRPVDPEMIVVPPAIKFTAFNLLRSATIVVAGVSGTVNQYGATNAIGPNGFIQPLDIVVDRYLTGTTAWYLFASPAEIPSVVVGFLRGNEEPQLLIQNPTMYSVAGGDDPYTIDFDDLVYKVRYEFGGAPGAWWGAYKSAGV